MSIRADGQNSLVGQTFDRHPGSGSAYIKARIYKRRNITYMRIYIKVITAALAAVGAAVGVAVAVAVVVGGWRWLRSSSEAVVFLDTAITRSAGTAVPIIPAPCQAAVK